MNDLPGFGVTPKRANNRRLRDRGSRTRNDHSARNSLSPKATAPKAEVTAITPTQRSCSPKRACNQAAREV